MHIREWWLLSSLDKLLFSLQNITYKHDFKKIKRVHLIPYLPCSQYIFFAMQSFSAKCLFTQLIEHSASANFEGLASSRGNKWMIHAFYKIEIIVVKYVIVYIINHSDITAKLNTHKNISNHINKHNWCEEHPDSIFLVWIYLQPTKKL